VLRGRKSVYYICDEREASLQRVSLAEAIAGILPGFDQVAYPNWDSLFERWCHDAPANSILALDEFPYLVKVSSEIPSILQRIIDQRLGRGLHFIIAGSSQRMMQGIVLDASVPLYGRAQEIIDVKPLPAGWIGAALRLSDPMEMLQAYSVWGGVPRYWELAADYSVFWESVRELVLDPLGVLHQEPRQLLLDDLRETAQAASLLSLIGRGCVRVSEIAARLEKPATSLSRPLQRLQGLGYIRREQPFGAPGTSSKKTLYRIDDQFLRFWYRYVDPNRSILESGRISGVERIIKRDIAHFFGEIWEELVRRSIAHLDIENTNWQPAHRWWGAGNDRKILEVDIISESIDGSALLVGEAKLSLNTRELGRVAEKLDSSIQRLPFSRKYSKIIRRIFIADMKGAKRKPEHVISGKEVFDIEK
jgi:AAA+ ATPase superfamily predicted ATPase